MNSTVKLSLCIFFVICLFSCSEDDPTEPSSDISGQFTLTQVNGMGLPFLAEETDNWQEFLSAGYLELIKSGRFEWEITWMHTDMTGTTYADDDGDGSYLVDGNTITFAPSSGNQFTGTLSNNRILTINGGLEDGITFTFQRD